MVGIVQKVPSTTNTTIHNHHHHGGAVRPSYDVGSMDLPDLMVVTLLEGVGKEMDYFPAQYYLPSKNHTSIWKKIARYST